jgi:hypothetical protein
LKKSWHDRRISSKVFSSRIQIHQRHIFGAGCQWLTLVILAIKEAEIWRIVVQSQPRQIVWETLS